MTYWLGVVSREHVAHGVGLGIAQIGHGKRAGIARMQPGDWLIYYSPRISLASGEPLQAFTAIGQVTDDVVWQADEGDFKPWRRRVTYSVGAVDAPIQPLTQALDLTSRPNWGHRLRRGLLELTEHDFQTIRAAMGA
jgi:hypothetical protein